jgi:hypothetical protein
MEKLRIIFFILLVAFYTSCNKESNNSTIEGDAVILSKRSGTDVVYGVALYAQSAGVLKTVTAVNSADPSKTISLTPSGGGTYYFIKEPTDSEYSTTKPKATTYIFNAVFDDGTTNEFRDILTADVIDPVTFEKCQYNATNSYAEISWTALANANSYVISVINNLGTTVFKSSEVPYTITSGTLSSSASGWTSGYPNSGETYTIRIYAYKYEDAVTGNYQLQANSISDATLVWGE